MDKQLKTIKIMKNGLEALCILKSIAEIKQKKTKRRFCSVRKKSQNRKENGFFVLTFLRLKEIDHQQFFIYTRMTPQVYEVLLNLTKPFLQKESIREPIQPECRLAVTLVYLTHGTSFQSLAWSFKLGKETVRCIILETTEIIWSKLGSLYLSEPNEKEYIEIAQDFWEMWAMPNCVGSIDGKHIAVKCPPNSGSELFYYKQFVSIVLLAACDARYRFTHIDITAYGSQSDGEIFQQSRLGKILLNKKLPLPLPVKLPNSHIKLPHFFVGDAAFPLCTNLMRPYTGVLSKEKVIFNKRLSKARRTIENALGILVSRWRVLLTTLQLLPENAEKIILSCATLHNFIMLNNAAASSYIPNNFTDWEDSNGTIHDGLWRSEVGGNIPSISGSSNSHHYEGRTSKEIRSHLCNFLSSTYSMSTPDEFIIS